MIFSKSDKILLEMLYVTSYMETNITLKDLIIFQDQFSVYSSVAIISEIPLKMCNSN